MTVRLVDASTGAHVVTLRDEVRITAKKPYVRPTLRLLGTVAELTCVEGLASALPGLPPGRPPR